LTRGYTFSAGAVAGMTSIAGVVGSIWVLYPLSHLEVVLLALLAWVVAVFTGAPFLGLWMLRQRLRAQTPAQ
jgi:hypothetical protein